MIYQIQIDTNKGDFDPIDPGTEISRILDKVVTQVKEFGPDDFDLRDSNGIKVGDTKCFY